MQNRKTIHIFGASGSGATTLAKAISEKYNYHFIDTDDALWENTDPPFTVKKKEYESIKIVQNQLNAYTNNVISGAFVGWGDSFKTQIDLFIYLHLPLETRLKRIQTREENRFKERVLPGGDLYSQHQEFLAWVSQYEILDESVRSQKQHEKWLKNVKTTTLVIKEVLPLDDLLNRVKPFIELL
ncbi:MAG: AAA family ATPase [Firmicutes bacterium]|nr:AAA family ATPase [Bacillota bacterium]